MTLLDIPFHPSGKFSPREQDTSPAAETLDANISANTNDNPVSTTTGMGFLEPYHVTLAHFWKHRVFCSAP